MLAEDKLPQWMEDYGDAVFRLCFLYLKDYHLAQDAAQETFLKAMAGYPAFRHQCTEKAWLTQIAVNTCKNYLRTSWFRLGRSELAEDTPAPGDPYAALAERDSLSRAILRLSVQDRQMILLYYYQELSMREIGQILGKSENTVIQRVSRARARLKKLLLEVEHDETILERERGL